jgi:hypothetical protein
MRQAAFALVLLTYSVALPVHHALAWGDEGHETAVRAKIAGMLAADTDTLTAHDIASAAT